MSSPIASKNLASPRALYSEEIRPEATSEAAIFKLFWQADRVKWRHSVRLEIDGKRKNLQLAFHPSPGLKNLFLSDYLLHYLQCYHFGVFRMLGSK